MNVQKYGLALGLRKTVDMPGTGFSRVVEDPSTQNILDQGPVLLVLTHNYGLEAKAAIAGLPESPSQDYFRDVTILSQPIPKDDPMRESALFLYNTQTEPPTRLLPKIRRFFKPPRKIDQGKVASLNAIALRTAGEKIGSGGLVVICPEGTREKYAKWHTGIGAVLKVAKRTLRAKGLEGYIIFCNVASIGLTSFLTDKTPTLPHGLNPYKNVFVRYSAPIPISDIDTELPREDLVSQIENKYKEWIDSPR